MKKVQIVLAAGILLSPGLFAQTPTLEQVLTNGNRTTKAILMSATSTPNPNNTGADLPYNKISFHSADFGQENVRIEGYYGNGHFVDRGGLKLYTRGGDGLQPRLVINPGGDVGIGTLTPGYKLDVNGTARVSNLIALNSEGYRVINNNGFICGYNAANDARSGYLQFNSGNNVTLSAEGAPAINLMTASTPRLYIHSNGNIGIGTGSAGVNFKLAINGSTNINAAPLTLSNSATDNSLHITAAAASNMINSYDLAGSLPKNLLLNSNGGNVGIGTSNPGNYKLAVEGTLGARKIKVIAPGTAWADYVFDSSYELKPLTEVDRFIQEHKHLPEVPTTADVTREGIDIGDNQALLLKKIEELTLYIIQQHKEMQEVKKEVAELKKAQAGAKS